MSDHVLVHKNGLVCRMIISDTSADRYDPKEDFKYNCCYSMTFKKFFMHSKVKQHVSSSAPFEAKFCNFGDLKNEHLLRDRPNIT